MGEHAMKLTLAHSISIRWAAGHTPARCVGTAARRAHALLTTASSVCVLTVCEHDIHASSVTHVHLLRQQASDDQGVRFTITPDAVPPGNKVCVA